MAPFFAYGLFLKFNIPNFLSVNRVSTQTIFKAPVSCFSIIEDYSFSIIGSGNFAIWLVFSTE